MGGQMTVIIVAIGLFVFGALLNIGLRHKL